MHLLVQVHVQVRVRAAYLKHIPEIDYSISPLHSPIVFYYHYSILNVHEGQLLINNLIELSVVCWAMPALPTSGSRAHSLSQEERDWAQLPQVDTAGSNQVLFWLNLSVSLM